MLTIENLSVDYYRRGQVIPAVRDFSLTIKPGETVGLVGESGSGKTTVALAILRLIRPQEGRITSGRILFQEQNLLALSEDHMREVRGKRISMIFQDPFTSLNPVMRIREQMAEVFMAHALPSPRRIVNRGPAALNKDTGSRLTTCRDDDLKRALEHVQLDPQRILSAYPHQLSGGQRQRVMIATALLTQPELILADEPTTALDVLVQKDILELLFNLQKQLQFGVLFISHHLALVARYTQRLIVMKEGKIIEENSSLALFRGPKHLYTQQLVNAIPRL